LAEVSLFDLLKAFEQVLGQIGDVGRHEVEVDEMELAERLTFVMKRIGSNGAKFTQMFDEGTRRIEVVATFLAILELIRQRQIQVQQNGIHGAIFIYPTYDGTGVR
jgi:segregation and condensation protein A